jgi:hypothetical protein
MPIIKRTVSALFVCSLLILGGCTSVPPRHLDNICHVFDEKSGWYDDARAAYKRWGTPIPVIMAFMHQESRFVAKAKPPRTRILWIFPGPRKSSAYGYAQAMDSTWRWYQESSGNGWSSRSNFDDAADFIGWYNAQSSRSAGIDRRDAYNLYLAYHEGIGGYQRGTYKSKPWLMSVARKVSTRANSYTTQLAGCEKRLNSSGWWPF